MASELMGKLYNFINGMNNESDLRLLSDVFKNDKVIDNPLRLNKSYPLLQQRIIRAKLHGNMDKYTLISLKNPHTYLGCCKDCPELCGINL